MSNVYKNFEDLVNTLDSLSDNIGIPFCNVTCLTFVYTVAVLVDASNRLTALASQLDSHVKTAWLEGFYADLQFICYDEAVAR